MNAATFLANHIRWRVYPLLRALLRAMSPPGRHGRLSILILHRVLPAPDPIFPDEIDARRFTAICGWVRDLFNVLPLEEAARRLTEGTLPPRALCITFDDGYADNCTVALPILQQHGLCATFFISTGFIGGGRMWNDTLIESVRRSTRPTIDLRGTNAASLGPFVIGTPGERRQAIDALIQGIKYLPPAERSDWVRTVSEVCAAPLPDDLMLSPDQVLELRRAGMSIGAHTVNHPILANLTVDEARREIAQGREDLERILDEPVTLFAYPNGKPGRDYHPETTEIVRDLGFACAVSTSWGAAHRQTDLLELPRFTPWDTAKPAFALRMAANLWQSRHR